MTELLPTRARKETHEVVEVMLWRPHQRRWKIRLKVSQISSGNHGEKDVVRLTERFGRRGI